MLLVLAGILGSTLYGGWPASFATFGFLGFLTGSTWNVGDASTYGAWPAVAGTLASPPSSRYSSACRSRSASRSSSPSSRRRWLKRPGRDGGRASRRRAVDHLRDVGASSCSRRWSPSYVQVPLNDRSSKACRSSERCCIPSVPVRHRHLHGRDHPGPDDHPVHRLDHTRHAGPDPADPAGERLRDRAARPGRWSATSSIPQTGVALIGAIMLGLGRALGETMAVTFVIGNANRLSASIFDPGSTIASRIANEFNEAADTAAERARSRSAASCSWSRSGSWSRRACWSPASGG